MYVLFIPVDTATDKSNLLSITSYRDVIEYFIWLCSGPNVVRMLRCEYSYVTTRLILSSSFETKCIS